MIPIERWLPSDGFTLEPNAFAAARETVRNLVLTAGPGAGKTEMLAQRADFLLRTGACRYPHRILAISFKVDAALNLKNRVRRRSGPDLAARLDSHTFHAFAKRLIDRFRLALKGIDALDPDYVIGERRVQNRSITFSDMVPLACSIISTNIIARNAVRQTYGHVFLDEFQDCTFDQYILIKECFLGTDSIITAVGDTKQSIMGWAGAMEGIFTTFATDFSAVPLNLYQNFRSAPRLRKMQNAMVKVMDPPAAIADSEIIGDDGSIEILRYGDDRGEAQGISNVIQKLTECPGVALSDICILVSKQQKLYCEKLCRELRMRGIPYREEDSTQDLASEPICRLVIDFLLVIVGRHQPAAHRRLLELLAFDHDLDAEQEYQRRSRWNRFVFVTREKIMRGQIDISTKSGLITVVEELICEIGRDVIVSFSSEYVQGNRLSEIIEQVISQIHSLLVAADDASVALASFSGDQSIRIMSIHKCKGLEFHAVFILGVENETFWGKLQEERSAYFVGISRAKQKLFLTVCRQREKPAAARRWDVRRTEQQEFLGYV